MDTGLFRTKQLSPDFGERTLRRTARRQNHRYVELMFSPSLFKRYGLETQTMTAAVRSGLAVVGGIQVSLIADLVRDYGPEKVIVPSFQRQKRAC